MKQPTSHLNKESEQNSESYLESLNNLEQGEEEQQSSSGDSREYYNMLVDSKLKEKVEPMKLQVVELQDKLHSSEKTIRDLVN